MLNIKHLNRVDAEDTPAEELVYILEIWLLGEESGTINATSQEIETLCELLKVEPNYTEYGIYIEFQHAHGIVRVETD